MSVDVVVHRGEVRLVARDPLGMRAMGSIVARMIFFPQLVDERKPRVGKLAHCAFARFADFAALRL
ncbi:hypothetical protein WM33_29070 [Burkholderia multivorans]|nr:hypothetical protein WM33_29070 [Burkholderia multivorans]